MSKKAEPMYALIPNVAEEDGQYLTTALEDEVSVYVYNGPLNELEPEVLKNVTILLPFIHPPIDENTMKMMPHLKYIATRSTGYDHIDLEVAKSRNIIVANVPAYGEIAVAEYTVALMLTLSRKVHLAYTRTRHNKYSIERLEGFDLYGKTLGVIGAGTIGLHVIRIAKGLGMNIVVHDVIRHPELAKVLGFRYVHLHELLPQADLITLHAPALPSNFHMINRESLQKMKPGAVLINTARGSLVEADSLLWGLENGILGGVALDVLESENLLQGNTEKAHDDHGTQQVKLLQIYHQLAQRDDVIITPHVAFNSREAHQCILDTTIENVKAFLRGQPHNLVTANN